MHPHSVDPRHLHSFPTRRSSDLAIKNDIVLVHGAVDLDVPERKFVEMHTQTLWILASGALFRCDGAEGRPALLDFLAAAVWAEDLALFVVDEGQDSGEEVIAIVPEQFVGVNDQPPRN